MKKQTRPKVDRYEDIEEAVANYAARCAEKLRQDHTSANLIQVFLHTNPHREDLPQYAANKTAALPVATNSSIELVKAATSVLNKIFKTGYKYMKAGVMVHGITPEDTMQTVLFDNIDHCKQSKIMSALDNLNLIHGRGTIRLASMEGNKTFQLSCARKSPNYTTNWKDILQINVDHVL